MTTYSVREPDHESALYYERLRSPFVDSVGGPSLASYANDEDVRLGLEGEPVTSEEEFPLEETEAAGAFAPEHSEYPQRSASPRFLQTAKDLFGLFKSPAKTFAFAYLEALQKSLERLGYEAVLAYCEGFSKALTWKARGHDAAKVVWKDIGGPTPRVYAKEDLQKLRTAQNRNVYLQRMAEIGLNFYQGRDDAIQALVDHGAALNYGVARTVFLIMANSLVDDPRKISQYLKAQFARRF